MYKHISGFIHTDLGVFFVVVVVVQVINMGEGFCVFLIGEEISEFGIVG